MADFAIGVDLGGTSIKAGLVTEDGTIVRRATRRTRAADGPEAVVARLAEVAGRLRRGIPEGSRLAGVGVGAPGNVSMDRRVVVKPPNFPGWNRVDVAAGVARHFEVEGGPLAGPVRVENDANAAALGSAFWGAGRPFSHFIMVTLGTGVGGAIIVDNKVFRGATGGAGEIGHMTIDYEGPYARSGVSGAIEAYLGHRFLSRHARYHLLTRNTRLHEMTGKDLCDITPKKLHLAAEAGDPEAVDVLAWAGHKLGVVLGSAVNLLDIRKVVVGGGVSAAGDFLLEPARETMRRFVMPGLIDGLEIVRETLGNDAGILGAARVAFEEAGA